MVWYARGTLDHHPPPGERLTRRSVGRWVQSVYVRREARKRGLFKFLYKTVRAQAAAEGARGVRLYVDNDNEVALKTYEKLGMGSHYKGGYMRPPRRREERRTD